MNRPRPLIHPSLLAFLLATFTAAASADARLEVERLADINQTGGGSDPSMYFEFDGDRYFVATTTEHGRELWRSAPAGETALFKDINPGPANAYASQMTSLPDGSGFIFRASNGDQGRELWFSDGTEAGTRLVRDINPGRANSLPSLLTVFDDQVYFRASTEQHGSELWRTDGTEAGTERVTDLNTGADDATPVYLTPFDGLLYFAADNGVDGEELYYLDPADDSVEQVADIDTAPGSGDVRGIAVDPDGWVYFAADDGDRISLWRHDGSTDPPEEMQANLDYVRFLLWVEAHNKLYFTARTDEDDPQNAEGGDTELWEVHFDTVERVANIRDGGSSNPSRLTEMDGELYFLADDGEHGEELWRREVHHDDPQLVLDLNAGEAGAAIQGTMAHNGKLWFSAEEGEQGRALWWTDGTDTLRYDSQHEGADLTLEDFHAPASTDTGLIFSGRDDEYGLEPRFIAKGSSSEPELIADIADDTAAALDRDDLRYYANLVVLPWQDAWVVQATDGQAGDEPWLLETGAVRALGDLHSGGGGSEPRGFTVQGGEVLFSAGDDEHRGLWASDGTEAGTRQIKDFAPGRGLSVHGGIQRLGDNLVFAADDDEYGEELWRSDGTEDGTERVLVIRDGSNGSRPSDLTRVGDRLVFAADDGDDGEELWQTNGRGSGTSRVKDINPGADDSEPQGFVAVGDRVFFEADDGASGAELWVSDLTAAGTTRVSDINPGSDDSSVNFMTPLPGEEGVIFAADDGNTGIEPWVSDGTEAGTERLADLVNGADGSVPFGFTSFDGAVFFGAYTDDHGRELHRYDPGTGEVTRVADLNPGEAPAFYLDLLYGRMAVVGDQLFFTADDGESGLELWTLTDRDAEPRQAADILEGPAGSNPFIIRADGDRLLVGADDGEAGLEFWEIRVVTEAEAGDSGGGSSGGGLGWPLLLLVPALAWRRFGT